MATSRREDLLVLGGSVWTIVGLFLDGYAHEHFRELESFLTPWHGVFYSGFAFTAWQVLRIVARRRAAAPAQPWSRAVPPGFGPTLLGLGLFTLGGVGDAIWHTVFGVEATIDALLSPTHVVLFVGLLLVLTTPLRHPSALAAIGRGWRDAVVPLGALVLAMALVAFFLVYLWGPGVTWVFRVPFDPLTETGEVAVMAGVGAALVATAVLVAPLAWLTSRTRLPTGAVTVLLVVVNALVVAAFDRDPAAVAGALVAGVVGDVVVRRVDDALLRARLVGVLVPATLWSVVLALQAAGAGLVWQPELWGGVIVFATLEGAALAWLATAPGLPTRPAPAPGHGPQRPPTTATVAAPVRSVAGR